VLFDLAPDAPAPDRPPERRLDSRIPSGVELVSQALASRAVRPCPCPDGLAHGRCGRRCAPHPPERVRQGRPPTVAPRTSINVAVHGRRRVAFAAPAWPTPKNSRTPWGRRSTTWSSPCAPGAADLLQAGDELPEIPLVSVVPVSVTPEVAELKGSNKVSAMFVQLPCELADPLERLRCISDGTKGPRRSIRPSGHHAAELGRARHPQPLRRGRPPVHRHEAGRPPPPHCNLVISNVPGPTSRFTWEEASSSACSLSDPSWTGWASTSRS